MNSILDIENWDRKDHFAFFKDFEEPFFGITVRCDCTRAYDYCKKNDISFFLYYLHCSLLAANDSEPFRYRIDGRQVIVYDEIHASATIPRENGTFGFSYIDFRRDFSDFVLVAKTEMDRVRNSEGLLPAVSGENVIHYSALPWLDFTSASHARKYSSPDSCPKITFGKLTTDRKKRSMATAVHVHHALMDASHVGVYMDAFQENLDRNPA